ncbi:hypothetical protein ASD8599_01780 [Ascidiaceihabitans donghaensis]|uniref:Uncharacterized protein n=1 Tax=Ascidiaceihabitans donghaensis TaxID=1510460 RepID=A0A2R8BDL3_9RHOB|nr:hypothetical protein [Ascidiaceihabitans donghaensis]SPH21039.1 hypothetical protein ASD8599_01780 [Ascidiaceihabitans donghaensis]
MSEPKETFAYSKTSHGQLSGVLISAALFILALCFLLAGETWSLLEVEGRHAAASQNFAVNLITAFAFGTFGFLGLFSIWKNKNRPNAIVLSEDAVASRHQGVLGRYVEVSFSDIQRLQKLSIDGVWELNVSSMSKHIRITKTSLADPDDFERLIGRLQDRAPLCTLDVVSRIDPPQMN